MNIDKRLSLWKDAGLLSSEQVDAILRHEQEKPSASWVLYGVVGLGILVMLTGIISIIAANWDLFSDTSKLVTYFLLLSALAYFLVRSIQRVGVVREALITSFALFVLAGIGLISQIYHLQGDGWQAIYFWLAIIFPLCLFVESRLLCNLWFLSFIYATGCWSAASNVAAFTLYIIVSLPFLVLAFGYALAHRISPYFCGAARLWSYAVLLIPLAVMANITFAEAPQFFSRNNPELEGGLIAMLPWVSVVVAILAVYARRIQPGKSLTRAIASTLVVLGIFLIPGLLGRINQPQPILGCILFVLCWSGAAWIAASLERKRLFDLATCVIGVRFIVVYFEVFGSLAATGIGLILSGFVILGVAWLWHQYRRKIAKVIRGSL
jgi:uncharacterized membrane protein